MWRFTFLVLLALASCKKSTPPAPSPKEDVISVPGVEAAADKKAPAAPPVNAQALKPEEGTLVVDRAEAAVGATAIAHVKIVPTTGYHVSTKYPTTLTLSAPAGVHLEKATFAAGKEKKGDADAFSEQGLSFAIKAVADAAGTYEINGTFSFGVCTDENCHPKTQPIMIAMTAK